LALNKHKSGDYSMIARRRLGVTEIEIAPVVLGCWPISGMTSIDVHETASLATLEACFDLGVNAFDTAYAYGLEGESERLIARVIRGRRDQVVICTKGGIAWNEQRQRVVDGRPLNAAPTMRRKSTATRDGSQWISLYLHAPDPNVPLAESAGALLELLHAGKARSIGVSNFTVAQLAEFHAVCPITAFQPPYNMLQRQIEKDALPWCR
jgi:aryl-alcohol dehydrogenase-like predicted oxidoreductase